MSLELIPLKRDEAQAWIREHHRHSGVPVGDVIRVGVADEGQLVGVATAGRPVARALDDGRTLEVTRVATDGTRNACSMLYASMIRAARALGYKRLYTYTLQEESGSSLRAVGWREDARLRARATWSTPSRPRATVKRPVGPKIRWIINL